MIVSHSVPPSDVFHMLDIVELRAVWATLPDEFENDQTGEKATWKANVLQKLQDLVSKEQKNSLVGNQKRNGAYKGLQGIFDPDATIIKIEAARSTAFDKTELPDFSQKPKAAEITGAAAAEAPAAPRPEPAPRPAPAAKVRPNPGMLDVLNAQLAQSAARRKARGGGDGPVDEPPRSLGL